MSQAAKKTDAERTAIMLDLVHREELRRLADAMNFDVWRGTAAVIDEAIARLGAG